MMIHAQHTATARATMMTPVWFWCRAVIAPPIRSYIFATRTSRINQTGASIEEFNQNKQPNRGHFCSKVDMRLQSKPRKWKPQKTIRLEHYEHVHENHQNSSACSLTGSGRFSRQDLWFRASLFYFRHLQILKGQRQRSQKLWGMNVQMSIQAHSKVTTGKEICRWLARKNAQVVSWANSYGSKQIRAHALIQISPKALWYYLGMQFNTTSYHRTSGSSDMLEAKVKKDHNASEDVTVFPRGDPECKCTGRAVASNRVSRHDYSQ